MEDSPFVLFLGFGFLWILMGFGGLFFLATSNGKKFEISPAAAMVALPIAIAFIVALTFGALAQ